MHFKITDFLDILEPVSDDPGSSGGAAPTGQGTASTSGGLTAAVVSPETVTYSGSGLIFVNSYGSGVTTTFRNEIVAAENYFQSHFTNACTINCSFDLQALNHAYSGENSFSPITVSYASYVSALQSHATTPDDLAAAAALSHLPDPSGGHGFEVPIGEARILGLAGAGSGIDDAVILNNFYWTATALQNSPNDAIAVIEHEISEGAMGRIGSLGTDGGLWAPMDLFRFNASGQRDLTGGRDGVATYFSTDGSSVATGLQYHNSINNSGANDGFDLSDWDQVGSDANALDPFGPGGPGVGDPGALSATDLRIMDVLGWTPTGSAPPPPPPPPLNLKFVGTNDYDANAKADILWTSNGRLVIWTNSGTAFTQVQVPGAHIGTEWSAVGLGRDPATSGDIIWSDGHGDIAVWQMHGTSVTGAAVLPGQMAAGWQVAGLGDFNADGNTDVLWEDTSGHVDVWSVKGLTVTSNAQANLQVSAGSRVAAVGDFYGTGRDAVLWEDASGHLQSWSMNGATVGATQTVGQIGAAWHVAGVGHFLNDGSTDIVWVNNNSDDVQIWQMNNGVISKFITPNVHASAGWQLESVNDFVGNGFSDLLWLKPDGSTQVWQINGNQVQVSSPTAPAGNTLQLSAPANSSAAGSAPPTEALLSGAGFNDPAPRFHSSGA